MDCFGIKRFLSQTCCSCRSGESMGSDEVQITKISKISATGSVHSVLASGNGEDHAEKKHISANGTDNLAYQAEETVAKADTPVIQQPQEKVVNEQPKLKPGVVYKRQTSDISAISDFAPVTDKELSEMVLEGLEKSFSNDETIKELEKSFHGREGGEIEPNGGKVNFDEAESNTEIRDETPAESSTENHAAVEEGKSESIADKQPTTTVESRELEWRNKLMQDLDDDEEFVLTSSEEEDDVTEVEEKRAKVEETESEINENTKNGNLNNSVNLEVNNHSIKYGGIPVVVDPGSYEIKAGLAGEFTPSYRFRTVIGKWRSQVGDAFREQYGELLFGEDALSRHNALALTYPIQDGIIDDWKDFESIFDYTLSHVEEVDIKEHPLLITEQAVVPKKQRERKLEVVMEALHCPMTQFRSQAALSAITAGSDVALVVNSGHGCTEVVPVYYGYAIQNGVQKVNVGGRRITEYFGRLLLKERGINFSSVADQIVLDNMKKQYAEVKNDDVFPTEAWNKMIHHELPDGGIIELGAEIYKCTQPMFRPGLIGDNEGLGLVEAIKQSVKSLDPDIQQAMKSSVLLSGGNCCLRGFQKQLKEKLYSTEKKKSKTGKKTWQVTSCHDLSNCSWIGGSLYADSDTFRDACVTDDAYFEHGASIIHRMCL